MTRQPLPKPAAPGVHPQPLWSFRPRSDREAGDAIVSNFLLHWFPAKVCKASLDWTYSFWLGTISAALFLLLILSGCPLLFLYVPSVERAYASVKDIEYVVTFGSWIRSVHRLAAHLMVVVVFLHLVRVFLTGAYKNGVGAGPAARVELGDRRRRCCSLTLFLSFTGYLLPWDQLAFWAVTVGTNIASSIPLVGPDDPRAADRRPDDRAADADPLLRAARHRAARRRSACSSRTTCGASARTAAWRAPTARRCSPSSATSRRVATKTYTLLGVARGTAPAIRATTLEAPDLTVNAVPDLTRRAAIVVLGTIAVVSILARLRPLAARGAGERARHAEPGEGALVLPLAAGDRHRHDDPPRLVHHQRRVPRRRAAAGPARRPADALAVARPEPGASPPASGSRGAGARRTSVFLALVPGRDRAHARRHLPARARTGTSTGRGRRGRRSRRGSEMETAHRLAVSAARPAGARRRRRAARASPRCSSRWNDREHDWRYYQDEFRRLVAEKFGADKAETVPVGHAADLGARARPRRPLRHLPPGRRVEGLRDGRGAVPDAPGRDR